MTDFPTIVPKHLRYLTYQLPLEMELTGHDLHVYAGRACERMGERFPYVVSAHPQLSRPSSVMGEGGFTDIQPWQPYIEVLVDLKAARPNTPAKIEEDLLEAMNSDDADKAEGSPPPSVS